MSMSWQKAVEEFSKYVVKISTPNGSGTGFLVSHSKVVPVCGVATAAHVIDQAHYWDQPIRIYHYVTGKSLFLKASNRAIFLEEKNDTAALIFDKGDLPLPDTSPDLTPEARSLKVGIEVGWLGFPAIIPGSQKLCFFSGRVSHYDAQDHYYLVDGVAINGVSGGPTFCLPKNNDKFVCIGVVSAYIVNRVTGETLPGVSMIQDVLQFQDLIKHFNSLDEAKRREAEKKPPPQSAEGDTRGK